MKCDHPIRHRDSDRLVNGVIFPGTEWCDVCGAGESPYLGALVAKRRTQARILRDIVNRGYTSEETDRWLLDLAEDLEP